ncbi:hypothetical protein AB0D11_44845 [Streptomyces monashensis]|uniref:hypothetical protein n=1 Tax=Streptomyces monashensis TaxID=1678012 RepID=UPI0033E51009
MRTLVKNGDPNALHLVGFHGGRDDLTVVGPLPQQTDIPFGGALTFTAQITNISQRPVTLSIDYAIHHMKANGKTAPKVCSPDSNPAGHPLMVGTRSPGQSATS